MAALQARIDAAAEAQAVAFERDKAQPGQREALAARAEVGVLGDQMQAMVEAHRRARLSVPKRMRKDARDLADRVRLVERSAAMIDAQIEKWSSPHAHPTQQAKVADLRRARADRNKTLAVLRPRRDAAARAVDEAEDRAFLAYE